MVAACLLGHYWRCFSIESQVKTEGLSEIAQPFIPFQAQASNGLLPVVGTGIGRPVAGSLINDNQHGVTPLCQLKTF